MHNYAPVSISVYDRVHHLRESIEALLKNPESSNTVLYIFSDAPRKGDEEKIAKVRNYIESIQGFKEVRKVFQESNSYETNMKQAREIPLREFGRIIRMEDDIVVSPLFLSFMNEALDLYKDDKRIFSISGYSPNFGNRNLFSAFLSKDFSAWGWASWVDRDIEKGLARSDYYSKIKSKRDLNYLAKELHPYLMPTLKLIEQGKIAPADYKRTAYQILEEKFSVKPGTSMVRNIGFDGTGMGGKSAVTNHFDTALCEHKILIRKDLEYDIRIDRQLFEYYFPRYSISTLWTRSKLIAAGLLPHSVYKVAFKFKSKFNAFIRQI